MKKNKILRGVIVAIVIGMYMIVGNIVFAEDNTINESNTENTSNELNATEGNNVTRPNNTSQENNTTSGSNTTSENNTTSGSNTTENENTTGGNTTPVVVDTRKEIQKLRYKVDTSIRIYTGRRITIPVEIYDGNKKLKDKIDFTVDYKNNINTGKATLTVYGLGDYKGAIRGRYFYIAPKQATIRSAGYSRNLTEETIRWIKDDKASGYKVYMSDSYNGSYSQVAIFRDKNRTTFKKTGLNSNKIYYFKVQAFVITDNRIVAKTISRPISALVSEVTLTASGSGSNRNYNLRRASDKIRGTILRPGDTFNWFKVVGPASKARGYKLASVFKNGKVEKGYGGGVCQVSSTLYQASRNAGLRIVERHIHSRPVTYTSLGNDATVSYGVQNLKIKNSKGYTIELVTSSSGQSTTCKIICIES